MSKSTTTPDRTLPDPRTEPTISLARAGLILGISRSGIYAAADRGEIPVIVVGQRRQVHTAEFLAKFRLGGGSDRGR